MSKISGYATLAAPKTSTVVPVVDTTDTTMAPTGTTKKLSIANLLGYLGFYAPPGLDPSGASDSDGAINAQLTAASAGQVVRLPPSNPGAHYATIAPIVVPSWVELKGARGYAPGHLGSNKYGTVLYPVSGFTQGAAPTNSVISFADSTNGQGVSCLQIDGSGNTAVDGIASLGGAESIDLHRIVIYNTNNGINQVTGSGSPANCDGWRIQNVLVQSPNAVGVILRGFDTICTDVHSQNANGDCWQIIGRHTQLIGCRGDVSATGYGFRFAAPYSSSSNDGNQMSLGGTQFNALGGIITDPANAAPLMLDGPSLDGDGTASGPQAGLVHQGGYVSGWFNTLVTGGFPKYALATVNAGSAVGCDFDGGMWNAVTGPVNDLQSLAQAIAIGSRTRYSSANGSAISSFTSRFGVSAAMSGTPGSVSVSNTWITATSRIEYSRKTAGGTLGQLSISAQSAGSVTFLSTGNETSTITYMILSQ